MGLRFRRRIRIAPGLSLNLSKRGTSLSVGGRGAHVTIGHGQVRDTVSLPGTGVSYTSTHRTGGDQRKRKTITLWQALSGSFGIVLILALLGAHGEWLGWVFIFFVVAGLASNFLKR
jgi:hypothetical protein